MTENLEIFNDNEYLSNFDIPEEEVDKLNDVTFGDANEWKCDTFDNDDGTFERFQFDEFESSKNQTKNDTSDLLGLKGSLLNFGLFKTTQNNCGDESFDNHKDEDFEIALAKLNMLDEESVVEGHSLDFVESPLEQLKKYSEMLYLQFQEYQNSNYNSQYLNGVIAKHLNKLSKKLTQLSLPMDVLAELKYFRLLTNFVSVDNRINEIRNKCANDPVLFNTEIVSLAKEFSYLSPQQQADLCAIHPFYGILCNYIRSIQTSSLMGVIQSPVHESGNYHMSPPLDQIQKNFQYSGDYQRSPQFIKKTFDPNDGGWMTMSEREWIKKVQTRNLIADNPYIHDYYYTALKFKEMTSKRNSQLIMGKTNFPDPVSLLPSPITADQLGAGIDPNKDGVLPQYHPIQFENSLGILTSSNLNTPRQTLQVPQRHRITVMSPDDSYNQVRNQRELLGIIEKVHCIVLRVDEVDKSLAKMLVEQHHNRSVLLQHRSYLLKILMDCVDSNVRFVQMFTVQKGTRILTSVIAIISPAQFIQLMRTFFFNCLSVWESPCFAAFESEFRTIIGSRIRKLAKDELSLLITTFFCNITSKSFNDKMKLQPLSGFCRYQFGLHVVFTVLDAFYQLSPEDRLNVHQLVAVVLKSSDSQLAVTQKLKEDFHILFTT